MFGRRITPHEEATEHSELTLFFPLQKSLLSSKPFSLGVGVFVHFFYALHGPYHARQKLRLETCGVPTDSPWQVTIRLLGPRPGVGDLQQAETAGPKTLRSQLEVFSHALLRSLWSNEKLQSETASAYSLATDAEETQAEAGCQISLGLQHSHMFAERVYFLQVQWRMVRSWRSLRREKIN
jgi:hypothetical protein